MDCSGHQRGSAEPGPFLLVCDLDGTLLGDDEALTTFFASWRARLLLEADMRQAGRSKLVYATGRPHGELPVHSRD